MIARTVPVVLAILTAAEGCGQRMTTPSTESTRSDAHPRTKQGDQPPRPSGQPIAKDDSKPELARSDELPVRPGAPPKRDDQLPEPTPMPEKPQPTHYAVPKSLPYLTAEEEAKIDAVIDKFIQWDIMQPEGGPSFQPKGGVEAVRNFEKLGREAIPALIRGLNKAARLEHSCPTLVISKKLLPMLLASEDEELLDYAREMIGAGVGRTSHARVLEDIRLACMKRKNELARKKEDKADK